MNIGLLGLTFGYGAAGHPNKGCEALSYSFLEILNTLAARNHKCYQVSLLVPITGKRLLPYLRDPNWAQNNLLPKVHYLHLNVDILPYFQVKNYIHVLNNLKVCDVVFDFTGGDSFTDIYGLTRYRIGTKLKKSVLAKKIPLVLGSQTIGPFKDEIVRKDAASVIAASKEVYVRDEMSLAYTKEISGRDAKLTTDIAFFLPYTAPQKDDNEKVKVGVNPSGLLWCGGYTGNNQFALKTQYREYCTQLVSRLVADPQYEVHLIPHCFDQNMESLDNDNVPILELHKLFPSTILAPQFQTAMDAKSYIAKMDIFTGARMHATVAAFSTGVPVIPFAYSRKFEGLFGSLSYHFTIDGKALDTDSALVKTLQYVSERTRLLDACSQGKSIVDEKSALLLDDLDALLKGL